jgi:hypothetical protein
MALRREEVRSVARGRDIKGSVTVAGNTSAPATVPATPTKTTA